MGAAGAPVVVWVGDESHGHRNVGVDLSPGRCTAAERRRTRATVREALVVAGVSMAPHALVPSVDGDLRGSVVVQELKANWATAMSRPG